jgi:lipopolysaccharide export system permease protein
MPILHRYLFREIAVHFVTVTGVLVVIYSSFLFAKVLLQAANNQFSQGVVLSLLGLASLQNLTQLVPIGLFLAIMLALGRLYHDSEMAAMQACGFGIRRVCRPVIVLTVLVVAVLGWLAFWISPQAVQQAHDVRMQAMREARFASLEPKRFRTLAGGDVVFYAERIDSDGILYNVFVQRRVGDKVEVVVADRAEQRGAGESQQTFILYNGERYEGVPGGSEFRIVQFSEHGIPVQLPNMEAGAARIDAKPTVDIFNSSDPLDTAEFQKRLSAPLMTFVLAILAVPLARLRPRQGRYANMGLALLAFFFYVLMTRLAGVWLERQTLPAVLGVWWVHVAVLGLALWLLFKQDPPDWLLGRAAPAKHAESRA